MRGTKFAFENASVHSLSRRLGGGGIGFMILSALNPSTNI